MSSDGEDAATEGRGDFKCGEDDATGLDDAGRERPPERRLTLEPVL